jgi:transcriptional regulator with XRE-family HTH domain
LTNTQKISGDLLQNAERGSMELETNRDEALCGALGERIRGLRKSLKLTQREFAERTAISVSYLSMIERTQRTPHIGTLARVAKELGVSVSQLLDGLEEGERTMLPLLAFLAHRRLNGAEINALLKVAQLMFRENADRKTTALATALTSSEPSSAVSGGSDTPDSPKRGGEGALTGEPRPLADFRD